MIKRVFPKGEFARNTLTLMTGTTIAQAIPVAISPILTRIYSPEDFGLLGLYIAISTIVAVVATGRYELTVLLPRKDNDAANLVVLSVYIAFMVSFFFFLTVLFFNAPITDLLGNPEISGWLYFVPVTVFFTGVYQSLSYWSNRKKSYSRLATSRVIQSGATVTTQVGAGFSGWESTGLIFGRVIGPITATFALGNMLWKEDKDLFTKTSKLKKFALARRYVDFPKYLIIAHLLNTASGQIPNILFNTLFSSVTAGFFLLTQRVIAAPMSIVASSIGNVFRQEASYSFAQNGQCRKIYFKTLKRLILISFAPFLCFYFFAPYLFVFMFGEPWRIAGNYAQILTPMFFLKFVTSPLSVMFMVAEKQKLDLLWQSFLFIFTISSFVGGYLLGSGSSALIMFSAVYSFMYFINGIMTAKFSIGKG